MKICLSSRYLQIHRDMRETSKSRIIRAERGDFDIYLRGSGIDIGCGNDLLVIPNGTVVGFDKHDGDATTLSSIKDNSFDFVYSSHCLEHLDNINLALYNWTRVIKNGGFLYFTVPDYELYEKCTWPSKMNKDHKLSFSLRITRSQVNRESHFHLIDLSFLKQYRAEFISVLLEDNNYDFNCGLVDQTRKNALAQICYICKIIRD